MLKIIIADDNQLVRQSLYTTIPWGNWGYEIIAEASNGIEAYEKIVYFHPDIVILDIHMTGMTGLEVVKKMKEMQLETLVILLSAYDKFAYAQEGLKLGIFDYLLKPVDNAELKTVLDKAAKKILQNRQNSLIIKRNSIETENWVGHLLAEGICEMDSAIRSLQEYVDLEWKPKGYTLIMLNFAENKTVGEFSGVVERIEEMTKSGGKSNSVKTIGIEMREYYVILLSFTTIRFAKDYYLMALKMANDILKIIETGGDSAFIGISDYHENLKELSSMYEEARFAINSRFFLENQNVVHYKSITSKSVHNEYEISKKLQETFDSLNSEPESFMRNVEEIIELINKEYRFNEVYIKSIITQIAFAISNAAYEHNIGSKYIKTFDMIMEEVENAKNIRELTAWMKEYAEYMFLNHEKEETEVSSITRRALDYINLHYMEHIGLTEVAEELGISESHMCRVLKNDTGETFVNIINKIRIQKAMQLLKSGQYKVYEIAEMVGFSNYAYFFQVFKKVTGQSPKNFQ